MADPTVDRFKGCFRGSYDRPALVLKAQYAEGCLPLQVHGYFSFSSGRPVYLFLIAKANDAMDWVGQVADRMQLLN